MCFGPGLRLWTAFCSYIWAVLDPGLWCWTVTWQPLLCDLVVARTCLPPSGQDGFAGLLPAESFLLSGIDPTTESFLLVTENPAQNRNIWSCHPANQTICPPSSTFSILTDNGAIQPQNICWRYLWPSAYKELWALSLNHTTSTQFQEYSTRSFSITPRSLPMNWLFDSWSDLQTLGDLSDPYTTPSLSTTLAWTLVRNGEWLCKVPYCKGKDGSSIVCQC